MRKWLLIFIGLLLAGCSSGAVVFAPTPLPADQSPASYNHPSGAFSAVVPRQWAVYEQNTTTLASAAFSAPGDDQPSVLFAVINLGHELDSDEFGSVIDLYQTQVRSDTGRYVEQSREAMGDGSWRMTGLRSSPGGAQQVNTFIQRDGTFIGLIDVVLPDDEAEQATLQRVVNSFSVGQDASLEPTDLTTLAYAKESSLGVLHVATWNTPNGVFFVTGEVANYGLTAVDSVPVHVDLRSADGLVVLGAVDTVLSYGIPPGGFAPFSLRFGQGQPSNAATYTVRLGGEDWQPTEPALFGQNEMTWTDKSSFDSFNRLVVDGTVTNVSDKTIRQPRATATVFDGEQNVIAAGYADITPDALTPGVSADFEISLPEMGGSAENYIVNIQGRP
jgi:hypothetical protein